MRKVYMAAKFYEANPSLQGREKKEVVKELLTTKKGKEELKVANARKSADEV